MKQLIKDIKSIFTSEVKLTKTVELPTGVIVKHFNNNKIEVIY